MSAYIIAEAGCNHLGKVANAVEMIDEAARMHCNAIKFQAYVTEKINDINLHKDLAKWRFTKDDFRFLKTECESQGIDFLCSSFDIESAKMLDELYVIAHKVPAGQIHNTAYLKYIASTRKTVYLSTGMCTFDEVYVAIQLLQRNRLFVMHCTTGYPVSSKHVNLNCIQEYQRMGYLTGFSDHTMNPVAAVVAVGLGARVIEHHFTLGHGDTPDTPASFVIEDLRDYIHNIREAECILGDGVKKIEECEKKHLHRRDYDIIQT